MARRNAPDPEQARKHREAETRRIQAQADAATEDVERKRAETANLRRWWMPLAIAAVPGLAAIMVSMNTASKVDDAPWTSGTFEVVETDLLSFSDFVEIDNHAVAVRETIADLRCGESGSAGSRALCNLASRYVDAAVNGEGHCKEADLMDKISVQSWRFAIHAPALPASCRAGAEPTILPSFRYLDVGGQVRLSVREVCLDRKGKAKGVVVETWGPTPTAAISEASARSEAFARRLQSDCLTQHADGSARSACERSALSALIDGYQEPTRLVNVSIGYQVICARK